MTKPSYFMLTNDPTVQPGATLPGGDGVYATNNPRTLVPSDVDDGGPHEAILDAAPERLRVLEVAPVAPVTEHAGEVFESAGWKVVTEEPLDGLLGPQATELIAAVQLADRVIIGDPDGDLAARYIAAVGETYAGPHWTGQEYESAARDAMERKLIDEFWWGHLGPDTYSAPLVALAARDLIREGTPWNQVAYDELTRPWRTTLGRLHSHDSQLVSA